MKHYLLQFPDALIVPPQNEHLHEDEGFLHTAFVQTNMVLADYSEIYITIWAENKVREVVLT